MKRNITISQNWRPETGNALDEQDSDDDEPIPSTSYGSRSINAPTMQHAHYSDNHAFTSAASSNRGSVMRGEEIANLLMQVADKKERCYDFDLQQHLTLYSVSRLRNINFPEAAMLIACAAQIYGRKVDYLSDIIMHMNDDQKEREKKSAREKKAAENDGESGATETDASNAKTTGRKRAGRFNPQSLSDCFGDLEFTCTDKKLLKLDALVKAVPTVDVDRRTKVQQMQDLCQELRTNPARQRRQEILNRLRDDACIAPIMSSNGAARKNQILDFESGDTIGTRYDYQIHLNYIDGQTGSLMAEHDLKRFFQRCDVIDFLSEQHDSEQERCTRLGMPAPTDLLAARERELKLYMPPEYLRNRYRITLNNTTDFDNAVLQARITNYSSDPILSLMDQAERRNATQTHDSAQPVDAQQDSAICSPLSSPGGPVAACEQTKANETSLEDHDSGFYNDTIGEDDPSFGGVLSSSRTDGNTSATELENNTATTEASTYEKSSMESTLEAELVALETQASAQKGSSDPKRLSVDEGIGVDRESPPRSGASPVLETSAQKSPAVLLFTSGTVFPRPAVLRPVKLVQNFLGILEEVARKHVPFALPMEYRKLKAEFSRRQEDEMKKSCKVQLFSLKSEKSNKNLRPSTPDQEDFLGFDEDELDELPPKVGTRPTKNITMSAADAPSPARQRRSSSPDLNFNGFDEQEIIATRKATAAWLKRLSEVQVKRSESPKQRTNGGTGTKSQPVTPTRTLSCDSGISDTVDRNGGKGPCTDPSEPISEDAGEFTDSELPEPSAADDEPPSRSKQPLQEHTDASNARIQQSMQEAKERFDKVSQWHRKLKPILIESEKRNHFDIHAYGTTIIDTFDPTAPFGAERITLAKVLEHKAPYSTARFFLSMLMLANTNNVQICNRNVNPLQLSSTDEIELRLLSRKRHHQELEALGELLPPNDGVGHNDRKPQRGARPNRKRKIAPEAPPPDDNDNEDEPRRPDPSSRLHGELGTTDDGPSFFDGVQQMYADLTAGGDAQRKRVAFRRGMRNCAYGLADREDQEASDQPPCSVTEHELPPEALLPPEPAPPPPSPFSTAAVAAAVTTSCDPDLACARSVFSLAESGYESVLGGADDI
uniref:Condensin-2 complex subunit H2 C-terminal domain-containing protein n=1 Tax=Anopheles dirus TaxID=7168 RepID=A0A182NKT3_9DIPT